MDIKNIAVEHLLTMPENDFFDRKSEKKSPKELAETLVAFANAKGGIIAIGITNRQFSGIDSLKDAKIQDFIQAGYDHCEPFLKIDYAYRDVITLNGRTDRILLMEVLPSEDKMYRTKKDEVFLRIGDETKRLNFEQRKELEYEKGLISFESEKDLECKLEDLDKKLVQRFKEMNGAEACDTWKFFFSRGLAKRSDAGYVLTKAGILLFAEFPTVFIPNAKVRVVKYDGIKAETGKRMNAVKNITVEGPLLHILHELKEIVLTQIRDFNFLDMETGKFVNVPEYPMDAWLEGIVNAVTHRSYNIFGDDIKILLYDDRMEIQSPGKFPTVVNALNIREFHYSRNPYIARTLNDFGWVKEFGEGVDRIYQEMSLYFLDEPVFEEKNNTVVLTLKNNILTRKNRQTERLTTEKEIDWDGLTSNQQAALSIVYNKGSIRTKELAVHLGKSPNTAKKILDGLVASEILKKVATSVTDRNQYYTFYA